MMFRDHRRAVEIAAGSVVATVVLMLMVAFDATRAAIQPLDDAWLDAVDAIQFPPLVALAEVLDVAGSAWVTAPLRLAVALWLLKRRRWAHFEALALAVAVSEVGIGLLKGAIARPRPPGGLVQTTGFSFPSGHATASAVTAITLVVVLLPPGPARWRWELRAGLFVFAMALSRTYLNAHWLSDAVAGTLFGTAAVLAAVVTVIGLRNRLRPRFAHAPTGRPPPSPWGASSSPGDATPDR